MPLGQFNDSPAAVICQWLINSGIAYDPDGYSGTATVWLASINGQLDSPDQIVEVRDTEPKRFGRVQVTGEESQLWAFQITVRSLMDTDGFTKMNSIEILLEQSTYSQQVTLPSGHVYQIGSITRTSGPMNLGRETGASKRFLRTYNAVFSLLQIS